jgi:peptide deformylase
MILKIARMGNPVLKGVAEPVVDPCAADIRRLIADMIDTLDDADAAGLAAPQVHVPLRLVMFRAPGARNGGEEVKLTVLINPRIDVVDDEQDIGYEGCLSVPGLIGAVPRFRKIRYRGLDRDGEAIDRVAEGFHARVVQHECDHLDGLLYPMRMTDLTKLGFVEETRRALAEE